MPIWLRLPQACAGSLCTRTWGSGLGQPTSKRARLACCGFRLGYRPVCDVPLAAFLLKLLLLLTLVVLAKLTFCQSPARSVATFVGGGCCLWVTTLKACVATLASHAASVRWFLVHTHLGLRSWPAHIKACSSGSLRVPPGVPPLCDVPLAAFRLELLHSKEDEGKYFKCRTVHI